MQTTANAMTKLELLLKLSLLMTKKQLREYQQRIKYIKLKS